MAFSDPITMAAAGAIPAKVAARIPSGSPTVGLYKTADGAYTIQVRQKTTRNRTRSEFVLSQFKVASDPLSANNVEVSASIILAFDRPKWGFSTAELEALESHLRAFMGASADTRTRLLNGEV